MALIVFFLMTTFTFTIHHFDEAASTALEAVLAFYIVKNIVEFLVILMIFISILNMDIDVSKHVFFLIIDLF